MNFDSHQIFEAIIDSIEELFHGAAQYWVQREPFRKRPYRLTLASLVSRRWSIR
jgi:hypothetical protein